MTQSRSPRARRASAQLDPAHGRPIGTPTNGVSPNTGPLATAAWLVARGLIPSEARWYVEILLGTSHDKPDAAAPTLLRIEVYSEEWGFWFRHEDRVSWIRVTDLPFVHGRDEYGLLAETPGLKNVGSLVRALERRFDVRFAIEAAAICSSVVAAEPAVRTWIGDW